jgi:hypothetical protein
MITFPKINPREMDADLIAGSVVETLLKETVRNGINAIEISLRTDSRSTSVALRHVGINGIYPLNSSCPSGEETVVTVGIPLKP